MARHLYFDADTVGSWQPLPMKMSALLLCRKFLSVDSSQTKQYHPCEIENQTCSTYSLYWVSWNNEGTVALGCGDKIGQYPLLLYEDLVNPYHIVAIALSTTNSIDGRNFIIPGFYITSRFACFY